jgi:uncharacterized protein YjbI with pentapeptide repeats
VEWDRLRRARIARALRRREAELENRADRPPIAEKADDLEAIKKAVEEAASVSGGLWLSYLIVLSYLAIAAGAVTHQDLLLERAVKLPFLNVELPLLAFFALAPFVFLITHTYALVHFKMLGLKASRFHDELRRQLPNTDDARGSPSPKDTRDNLRRLLPSNIFVQILAGPPELRAGVFGFILKLIALTTLVLLPVSLLLLLQVQFLPYHSIAITLAHRAAVFLDILILWVLRPPLLIGARGWSFHERESGEVGKRKRAIGALGLLLPSALSLLAIWLSAVIMTIPGEWQEKTLAGLDPTIWPNPNFSAGDETSHIRISTRARLFAGKVDDITRRRKSLFSNTLVLPSFNIYQALKIDNPEKAKSDDQTFDLRGRRLDGAVFTGANLAKVDLTGAHLEGASLDAAQLPGARLDYAHLQGAKLVLARFKGASFENAEMQGVELWGAQLQGASLNNARLRGASFGGLRPEPRGDSSRDAQTPLSYVGGAQLQAASLDEAELEGASLEGAYLQGASLAEARLQGASLDGAQLQGASFRASDLTAASLNTAFLWRANFDSAKLRSMSAESLNWVGLGQVSAYTSRSIGPMLLIENDKISPWRQDDYIELLKEFEQNVPDGYLKERALERIKILDCSEKASGSALASCDPQAKEPQSAAGAHKTIESVAVDQVDLAKELEGLVCKGDPDAIFILRGLLQNGRIKDAGIEAVKLIEHIQKDDCPVSPALTVDDKEKLQTVATNMSKK